jgi:hypothetical protein
MVRWFTKNKGNTFAVLYQQLRNEYPELAKAYDDEESMERRT